MTGPLAPYGSSRVSRVRSFGSNPESTRFRVFFYSSLDFFLSFSFRFFCKKKGREKMVPLRLSYYKLAAIVERNIESQEIFHFFTCP